MRKIIICTFVFILSALVSSSAFSHCEIPCGIYGDKMRVDMLNEHITTIEKSMNMIMKLSAEKELNCNQIVRWVSNKDSHAVGIQDIVYQYFMTQRVKPVSETNLKGYTKYLKKLAILHQILFNAMKTKQTTDLSYVEKLRLLVQEFSSLYFEKVSE